MKPAMQGCTWKIVGGICGEFAKYKCLSDNQGFAFVCEEHKADAAKTFDVEPISETTFNLGDEVYWKSQANGSTKRKRGKVVGAVSANRPMYLMDLRIILGKGFEDKYSVVAEFGFMSRPHKSYLVAVDQGGKRKPKLYWPRVSKLRRKEK
jgi:hypothetical protein